MATAPFRKADPFGIQRVLGPKGRIILPQQADALDPALPIAEDELLIEVESLSVDSTAFRRISDDCAGDSSRIQKRLTELIASKGKLHVSETGSGGMLVGRVSQIGPAFPVADKPVRVGDRIATLVSLSLTPLEIRNVRQLHPGKRRMDVEGHAILFASGLFTRIPDDLPETIALAALSVAGVPAQVRGLVREDQEIVVIGAGGKAGLLSLYQAKQTLGVKTIAIDSVPSSLDRLARFPFVDEVVHADARDAVDVMDKIWSITKGEMADLVINVANVPGTEMASILASKRKGTVCFFNLATHFALASLGAEGVGAEVDLRIGNGCAEGHAELTLDILRDNQELRKLFTELYG